MSITREKLKQRVRECFVRALKRFNQSCDCESLLSEHSSNEPTISHRLAYYIEAELRKVHVVVDSGPYSVDCEYSRHGQNEKQMYAQQEEVPVVEAARGLLPGYDSEGGSPFTVRPDILVHKRRDKFANNLLVVEVKKRKSTAGDRFDLLKLIKFTSTDGYQYDYGVQVTGGSSSPQEERKQLNVTAVLANGEHISLDPWV